MGIDRETEEGVLVVKREIHKRTGVSSTGLRQKMRIEVNTLEYVTGGVLFIECENKRWKLVVFLF